MTGKIEVITGCMFSGKSEELIRRVIRAKIAKRSVEAFKPSLDNRYSNNRIDAHNGASIEANVVEDVAGIAKILGDNGLPEVLAIDEVQFFDSTLVELTQSLASRGARVIVSGLDMDFRGEPFGPMPGLLAVAHTVDKLKAICMVCGLDEAMYTQRIVNGQPAKYSDPTVLIGAEESYEARCLIHHQVPR